MGGVEGESSDWLTIIDHFFLLSLTLVSFGCPLLISTGTIRKKLIQNLTWGRWLEKSPRKWESWIVWSGGDSLLLGACITSRRKKDGSRAKSVTGKEAAIISASKWRYLVILHVCSMWYEYTYQALIWIQSCAISVFAHQTRRVALSAVGAGWSNWCSVVKCMSWQ